MQIFVRGKTVAKRLKTFTGKGKAATGAAFRKSEL